MEIKKEKKEFLVLTIQSDGSKVLTDNVEIDIDNNYELVEAIESELAKGTLNFILELRHVRYIDSSGFSAILGCYQQIMEKGGIFKILNPGEHVKRVLNILKIEM